jgi:protoporphyrinogen oxidase
MKKKYDIIILGSGISGMSLAYYCAQDGLKVLVIEKNKSLGGSFTTEYAGDFWLEMGAHTMYNSYGNLIDIIEGCGLKEEIIRRKKVPYKTYKQERIHSVISQFNIPELLFSLPALLKVKKDNQTVESYYSKIVGKKNYRRFFQYMFNAVPSQPTNDFPANVLFKKRTRRKDILKSYTLKKGIRSIINAVAEHPDIDIIVDLPIKSVVRIGSSLLVNAENNQSYESSYVGLATSINVTGNLVEKLNPEISRQLDKIKYTNTDSVGIIIKKEDINLKEVAGIIGINEDFYSVVSRDVVDHPEYRGFVFHFKPGKLDNKEKVNYICKVLNISENNILHTFNAKNIVPSFRLGHGSIVSIIDQSLSNEKIFLTGNYFSGMAIEDCVSRSKQEHERLQKLRK